MLTQDEVCTHLDCSAAAQSCLRRIARILFYALKGNNIENKQRENYTFKLNFIKISTALRDKNAFVLRTALMFPNGCSYESDTTAVWGGNFGLILQLSEKPSEFVKNFDFSISFFTILIQSIFYPLSLL